MNILLTNKCNRNCPYCFARERISFENGESTKHKAPTNISLPDFQKAIAFAKKSRLREIGLLGGEPSMRPQFMDLLHHAWEEGFRTKVFTNALWRTDLLEEVKKASQKYVKQMGFIVNMNEPTRSPDGEHERQYNLFRAVPGGCSLSFNISVTDFDATFLVDVIRKFGIRKDIRLGVAQPLADMPNEHVAVADYHRMAPSLMRLAEACDAHDVRFGFDCGFTLCMFTPEEVGRLVLAGARFKSSCGPAIDVGTDLSLWACFPLSTFASGQRLEDFEDHRHITRYFEKEYEQLYRTGVLDECMECRWRKRRQCNGGCAAHVYRRFNP